MKTINNVKLPSLFSIEYQDKTSYLLGTMHILPLSVLPDECIKIIHSCSSVVIEQATHDYMEYYTKAVLRAPNSPCWLAQLPNNIANFIEELINTAYNEFDPRLRKKADELEIWAAYQMAVHGLMIQLAKNQSTEDESGLGMDNELCDITFAGKSVYGLEGKIDKIPRYKREANNIHDLINFYHEVVTLKQKKEHTNGNKEISLESVINNYCSGVYLFSMHDATCENNERDTIERNLQWIPNILNVHQHLPGSVLFAVGGAHLIGENGLLSLLALAGARIGILKPDSTFQDYLYPFSSTNICKMALSHERSILHFFNGVYKKNRETMEPAQSRTLCLDKTTADSGLSEQTISDLKKSKLRGWLARQEE